MTHTKGKLEANGNEIYANNGRTFIAKTFDENENVKGDTQRLVKTWNNYDDLLEACKKAQILIKEMHNELRAKEKEGDPTHVYPVFTDGIIEQAIKKAE